MATSPELIISTKFHADRRKIVDVLIIVTLLASPKFAYSPSTYLLPLTFVEVYLQTLYSAVHKPTNTTYASDVFSS